MKTTADVWNTFMQGNAVIAGPCAAESREQVITTAEEIVKNPHVSLYRAGLWKPRTRPGAFEGVGKEGIAWIKEVQEEIGLPVCAEVMFPEHVELLVEQGITSMWIGARTMGSSPHVQKIADALSRYSEVNPIVFLKNPPSVDVELWKGNTERVLQAGIAQVGGIFRGYSTEDNGGYRNKPIWETIAEYKEEFPDVPVICDPSHITGDRERLLEVSKAALETGSCDGLMVETHNAPDSAKCDSKQQITPSRLENLLEEIFVA